MNKENSKIVVLRVNSEVFRNNKQATSLLAAIKWEKVIHRRKFEYTFMRSEHNFRVSQTLYDYECTH